MRHRQPETHLPGWLWFFLILPGVLAVALLYRRRRDLLQQLAQLRRGEPEAIPLEDRAAMITSAGVPFEGEAVMDEEDTAAERVEAGRSEAVPAAEEEPPAQLDDLVIIEGIGPSIQGLLRAQGITTFRQLAETPQERLDQILTEAKLRRLADPATWPEQAHLAAEGRMDELEALQGTLKAGRRRKAE